MSLAKQLSKGGFPFELKQENVRVLLGPVDRCVGDFPDTRISIDIIEATDTRLKEIGWTGAHIKSSVAWPTRPHIVHFRGFELFLLPGDSDLLPAIFVRNVSSVNDIHRAAILRFLSIWSWIENRAIAVETWTSGSHPFRAKGVGAQTTFDYLLKFPFWPKNLSRNAEIAIALYREGQGLNHIPYRILSYIKIINLLEPGNNGQRKVIEKYLPKITDTQATKRLNELGSNPDGRSLPDYILQACRHAVAHANLNKGYVFDPDDPVAERRLLLDSPIIESLASLVIRRELGVPSRSDNWKSKTHFVSGAMWWIGKTVYQEILDADRFGRRSVVLPKRVHLLIDGKPQRRAFCNLQNRVEKVEDGVVYLGLSTDNGLVHFTAAIDFNVGRLIFDPMHNYQHFDDGSVLSAEYAADIQEFFSDLFRNGVCQLWEASADRLIAEADAYLPMNLFFDPEGHRSAMIKIEEIIEARRSTDQ